MSDDLAAYLDAIDERFAEYLDIDRELSGAAVRHVRLYALALLEDLVVPAQVAEDWPDFFDLAEAFVLAYGSRFLDELSRKTTLFGAPPGDIAGVLGPDDRLLLEVLARELYTFMARRARRQ